MNGNPRKQLTSVFPESRGDGVNVQEYYFRILPRVTLTRGRLLFHSVVTVLTIGAVAVDSAGTETAPVLLVGAEVRV